MAGLRNRKVCLSSGMQWVVCAMVGVLGLVAPGCVLDRMGQGPMFEGPVDPNGDQGDLAGMTPSPGAPGSCGDGVLSDDEVCDGELFADRDCASFGRNAGRLRCTESCEIDDSECFAIPPYITGYFGYRMPVTVGAGLAGEALENFPLLVAIDNQAFFKDTNAETSDVLFMTEDGTILNHEFDGVTFVNGVKKVYRAWVRVPRIEADKPTRFFVYYGERKPFSKPDPRQVWSTDFQAVWHLNDLAFDEETKALHQESTKHARDAKQQGNVRVDGIIGYAQAFDGYDDAIVVDSVQSKHLRFSKTNATISAWVKTSAVEPMGIVVKAPSYHEVGDNLFGVGHQHRGRLGLDQGWVGFVEVKEPLIDDGQWHHVAWTQSYDSNADKATWRLYVDGQPGKNSKTVRNHNEFESFTLRIGGRVLNSYYRNFFDGAIDEVRIESVARSESWLRFSHDNQRSPTTLPGVGLRQELLP